MQRQSFAERVLGMFNGAKPPEIKAVRYWNRDVLGPVVSVPVRDAAGNAATVEMVIPLRERPRDRSKYKPHAGARQIARQRLGGFSGKPRDEIQCEIEIARGEFV